MYCKAPSELYIQQAVINIRLVRLPLNSGPKLAMGQGKQTFH